GVMLTIDAQIGTNIRDVSAAVEQAVKEMKGATAAEGFVLDPSMFRPADFIDVALRNIGRSLLLGGVLVAVVLVLFIADLGAAAVSLTAIPLSLLTGIIVLEQLGFSISTMSLAGLAIAIGEVVDDAIIDVENIARRLRDLHRSAGLPAGDHAHRSTGSAVPAAGAVIHLRDSGVARRGTHGDAGAHHGVPCATYTARRRVPASGAAQALVHQPARASRATSRRGDRRDARAHCRRDRAGADLR